MCIAKFMILLLALLFVFPFAHDLNGANKPKNAKTNHLKTSVKEGKQPAINIVLNLHMDPWGKEGEKPEALMAQYGKHRDAFLWLCNLAREKGFKITADITGFYAEYVIRQNHITDFLDFMPGKTHFLGTHLHENFKASSTPYVWAQSWDSKDAQKIFSDQILAVNNIFKSLGYSELNNRLIHGVVVECEDPDTCYGARGANHNPYPNYFDVVTGYGLLNNPYRTSSEGLYRRAFIEDLDGKFVAIPKPTAGFIGIIHDPLKSPQKVNLTLPIIQKDFILEYIEWKTYNILGLPPRPWIFAFDIHTLDLNEGLIGGDGKEIRKSFGLFYDWINKNFREVSKYATAIDVAKQYVDWERKNPNTLMYDRAEKYAQVESNFLTKNIYNQLKGYGQNPFSYHAEYTLNQNKVYAFRRHTHEQALLVVPNGTSSTIDLTRLVSGRVKVVSRSGEYYRDSASNISISLEPVLVIVE